MKAFVEPATLFGNADRSESEHKFAIELLNSIVQACIRDKLLEQLVQYTSLFDQKRKNEGKEKACRSLSNEDKNLT